MSDHVPDDVDPAGRDLRQYTDQLRPGHPVVRNVRGEWVLLRHADVVRAAEDPATFSSAVSAHVHVPNGLDGDAHRAARQTLDRYFEPDALAPHEPAFREVARSLFAALPRGVPVDAVRDIGFPFAVRAQSAWLGWPASLEAQLLGWMAANHAATRSGDRARTAEVAAEFDAIIRSVLAPRRALGDDAPDDLTTALLRDEVAGRPFTDEELVSVLRNWTGGDLGSIALCVGVLFAFLADHPELQRRLRSGVSDAEIDATVDEILRIDDPFISNRRRTTCPVDIAGATIPEGAVVKLHWTSANRDAAVFADPDAFDPEGKARRNLVYGTGPHVCPGRPLATLELRIGVQEALAATTWIEWAPGGSAEREVAPLGGWAHVPVLLG
ncbi:cytochrome P450 [Tessaracoccus sp. MC1679]|uniref:cytochrome P450 n=1 Tax=Tessaracoccus sp. MC1679 TaxID=2760313 RepID=UPI0015FF0CA8|nr:cytochrome P450 [Tessaracoccus sp. MC1679]MBB1515065.1 cytochrome P450 [Tessaracoccus sp. MC1679]